MPGTKNSLLKAALALPAAKPISWFTLLNESQKKDVLEVRAAFKSGKLRHLTRKSVFDLVKQKYNVKVSLSQFREWLRNG